MEFADSILKIAPDREASNCKLLLWFRFERGELLELTKRFDLALEEYYDIIRKAEQNQWWDIVAHCHISIGRCHETINRKVDCLRHLTIALKIIKAHHLDTIYAHYCYRYASYHRIYDNVDSAKVYATKAIFLGSEFGVERAVVDGHLIMGIITENIDTASNHFRMAARLFADQGDFHGAASQIQNIASKLIKASRLNEAMNTLDTALVYIMKGEQNTKSYFEMVSSILDKKSSIFYSYGNLDSAYYYLLQSKNNYQKSHFSIDQDSITQQAMNFAIEKEKEKNIYLEKNAMILQWGFVISISGLLLFLTLFAINRKRRQKIEKQSMIIQDQKEALEVSFLRQSTLLSEVHHRVKNNLQLVISLLTLQGKNHKDEELNMLLDEVSGKVKSIALIHEQLYSTGEFETINVQEYLEKLMENFEALQGEKLSFSYEVNSKDLFFNLETVMPIGIISSELISNALKYARMKDKILNLYIGIEKTENGYLLQYYDNGPGMPDESNQQTSPKIGISLIKSMVRQLQAESKTFNKEGYHFTMVFQEKKVSKI